MIEPVAAATSSRVGGLHVLSVQDTTGFRDDGRGHGLVGHATIAVEAEQGALLGLLDAELIERREDDPEPAPGRSFRARRSCRWMAGMKPTSTRCLPAVRVRPGSWSGLRMTVLSRVVPAGCLPILKGVRRKNMGLNCLPVPARGNGRPGWRFDVVRRPSTIPGAGGSSSCTASGGSPGSCSGPSGRRVLAPGGSPWPRRPSAIPVR